MIPTDNPALYAASLLALKQFRDRNYRGRIVQIFLAAKYYGGQIPRYGSGERIDTGEFQRLVDALFRRNHPDVRTRSIKIIFANNHLTPSGERDPDREDNSNIWRNNLQIQKATICFAPEAELLNPAFVVETRTLCPYLRPVAPGSTRNARCAAAPDGRDGRYRNLEVDGPKTLRFGDGGYSIADTEDTEIWASTVLVQGNKLPVVPLIAAIYFDADVSGGRVNVDIADFCRDFNFTAREFHTYFDDDPAHRVHAALRNDFPGLTWTRLPIVAGGVLGGAGPAVAAPAVAARAGRARRRRELLNPDDLPNHAPRVPPPAVNHWWGAEQAIAAHLEAQGWEVRDRTRDFVGFDFEVVGAGRNRRYFIEVKSSAGPCAPVLTRGEHEAAVRHGDRYILAIVEHFVPGQPIRVLWVRNPSALDLVPRHVEEYPVPRAVWLPHAALHIDDQAEEDARAAAEAAE